MPDASPIFRSFILRGVCSMRLLYIYIHIYINIYINIYIYYLINVIHIHTHIHIRGASNVIYHIYMYIYRCIHTYTNLCIIFCISRCMLDALHRSCVFLEFIPHDFRGVCPMHLRSFCSFFLCGVCLTRLQFHARITNSLFLFDLGTAVYTNVAPRVEQNIFSIA